METSILLAKIMGPMLLIVGIGIFVNLELYRRMVADFGNSLLLIYMSGTIALVMGLIVVTFHNVWAWRWPVIVTVIGWLSLIKGTVRIVAPRFVADRAARYARNGNVLMTTAIVAAVIGAVLTYFGYVPSA